MKILVTGSDLSYQELIKDHDKIEWIKVNNINSFSNSDATAFFDLSADAHLHDYSQISIPVFINCVYSTLKEIHARKNIVRINGWNTFLKRTAWEVAGNAGELHIAVFNAMQKQMIQVPDEPGFISARIISMIINEAFYAKEENVSTENEIDTAMKLGTNYPLGPFEWAEQIGVKNIYDLLISLSKVDVRYKPCLSLERKVQDQWV